MPNSTEVCFRNENAGAEQNIELESEFSLMRFISRFLRWPVEKRNKVLLSAEKLCIGSSD